MSHVVAVSGNIYVWSSGEGGGGFEKLHSMYDARSSGMPFMAGSFVALYFLSFIGPIEMDVAPWALTYPWLVANKSRAEDEASGCLHGL